MNPTIAGANGVVVITQVIPPNGQHAVQVGPSILQNAMCQVPEALAKFFKGEPKALGVSQILIGLMQIILAIVLATVQSSLLSIFVISGSPFWGGLFFIISGSLSVAAQNKSNMCLVKGSLVMNIFSAIAAFTGIILLAIDLGSSYYNYYSCSPYNSYDYHPNGPYYYSNNCQGFRNALLMVVHGVEGVLLLLMLLEFCISIATSAFGCKATCCTSSSNVSAVQGQRRDQQYPVQQQSVVILQNEFKPEGTFNPVAPPPTYVNGQYRPEANCPSVPAPAYNEINYYRPEANLSAMAAPIYSDAVACKPHVNPPSMVPLIPDGNQQHTIP